MAKPFTILSMDGGGIRGVITAQFLVQLEQELGRPIFDAFDYFAGTSTGALIALHLAVNKATAQDCLNLYSLDNGRRIMDKSVWDRMLPIENEPKYDGVGKRQVLTEVFRNARLMEAKKPVLVTTYDIVRREAAVFKSEGGSNVDERTTVVEVADATSAAPTYFPTVKTASDPPRWLVDGGLAANNPAACALAEALRSGYSPDAIRIVSIGTGTPTRDADKGDDMGRASQKWGAVGWITHGLIDHFFAGGSTAVDYLCKQVLGERFVRVNGPLEGALDDLDAVTEGNLNNLKRLGQLWFDRIGGDVVRLLRAQAAASKGGTSRRAAARRRR